MVYSLQVGNLLDVYHFVHVFSPTRARRNANEIHPKHLHLQSEDYVKYFVINFDN